MDRLSKQAIAQQSWTKMQLRVFFLRYFFIPLFLTTVFRPKIKSLIIVLFAKKLTPFDTIFTVD